MRLREPVPLAMTLSLGLPLLLGGCHVIGPCFSEQIVVSFTGTVTSGQGIEQWAPRGMVTTGNVGSAYQTLAAALVENTASAAGAVWMLDTGFGPQMGFLAVQLNVDPAPGQVVSVTGAFQGGGWGFLAPSGGGARVASRIADFVATAATGTLTVLDTAPLRLAADITLSDGAGRSYRFDGTMTFEEVVEEVTCD